MNGDGAPDIVIGINGAPPAVYLNNGTANPFENVSGAFVSPRPGPSDPFQTWGGAVVVDANADGRPDLSIAGFNSPNRIYLNNGTATPFNGATGITIGTAADVGFLQAFGDVNGDGFPDMANANTNHAPSRLYLTQGAPLTSGTYTSLQIGTDLGYGRVTGIADVNGDGRLDVILGYEIGSLGSTDPTGLAIYLNNGTANPFGNVSPLRLLSDKAVLAMAFADLNHDGETDLVTSTSGQFGTTVGLSVFLNTGSSSQPFVSAEALEVSANVGEYCLAVSAADVDGDALPDLSFACAPPFGAPGSPRPDNAAVGSIYLNNGTAIPFANVAPVDIPAAESSGTGYGIAVGRLVANDVPHILIVDADYLTYGSYMRATFVQDPVAQNDSTIVAINRSVQIDVLGNDTAGPGQTLNASSVTITAAPQHGTASVNSNGSVRYEPGITYTGADSLAYTVRDAVGARSQPATVSITVQPAPVANNDLTTLSADRSVTLDVLVNDNSSGGTVDTASINIAVAPLHGVAVVANGRVVYTPAAGYTGVDAFQYSVQDNLGTVSNLATVSLSVQPAPVAANDSANLQANQNVTINVLANDTSAGGTLDTASIRITSAPAHGSASVTSGQVVYTPTAGYSGTLLRILRARQPGCAV